MSVLPPFDLIRPTHLDEALEAISFDQVPYAGGTEILLAMRAGLFQPRALVDLKAVPELAELSVGPDRLLVGGAATHRSVGRVASTSSLPVLHEVLEKVGNPRVRASGTLGGNLSFAEPKSDVTTLLTALGATVELRSATASRMVPMSEFLVGPYTTIRTEDELITSIMIPLVAGRRVSYQKFQTMERPTVGVAAVEEPDGTRRVVVGAVGGRPEVHEFSGADRIDGMAIASAVEVIPDLTGGERYKRHVTGRTIEMAIHRLEDTR